MQALLVKDKTKFCDVFGYSQETKILELLLEGREYEYTLTDIVNALKINKKKAYQILHYYVDIGFLVKSKKVKHFQFYQLNKNNIQINLLIQLFDYIAEP